MSSIALIIKAGQIDHLLETTLRSVYVQDLPFDSITVFIPVDARDQLCTGDEINWIFHSNNLHEKVLEHLSDLKADYFTMIDAGDFYPADFVSKMSETLLQYNIPDLILFKRKHEYAFDNKYFSTCWSSFQFDSLISNEEFAHSFSFIAREYEAMDVYDYRNRLYKNIDMNINAKEIAQDFCRNSGVCGLRSLTIGKTVLTLHTIWNHHICVESAPDEVLSRLKYYYDDMIYIYAKWYKTCGLTFDFEHIIDLYMQHCLWQLEYVVNNISAEQKIQQSMLKSLEILLCSESFQGMLALRFTEMKSIFAYLWKIIALCFSERGQTISSNKEYLTLATKICQDYSVFFPLIMMYSAYFYQTDTTKPDSAHTNDSQEHMQMMPEVLKYIYCMTTMKKYLNLASLSQQFDQMLDCLAELKDKTGDCLTLRAFETTVYLFINEIEDANLLIEKTEEKASKNNLNIIFYYQLCHLLCQTFGMQEISDEFKTQIAQEYTKERDCHER